MWPQHSLVDQARNPDLDNLYVVPEVTVRKRNGTFFYRFEVNNAAFHLIVYPRKDTVLVYHSGNRFKGYIEFAWGTAPTEEQK